MKNRIDTKYFIPEGLNENSVVIEGGGYVGEWALWLHNTHKCNLHVFEPSPDNYKQIVDLFGMKEKVVLMQRALWDTDGLETIYLLDGKPNGNSLYDRSKCGQKLCGEELVMTTRLDTYMNNYGIDRVDLLKLNVEGAEVQILMSLDWDMARRIKNITYSTHEGKIIGVEDCVRIRTHLQSIGYEVERYTDPKWDFKNRWKATHKETP